jgi:iron complex outermembrane recepter protein
MSTSGARSRGVAFAVASLMFVDARLASAQQPTSSDQSQSQEGIQEVVVTAERRAENLQTTPIAITALSAETLNKQGVTDFAGVAQSSTSLNFTPYPSSSNTLILYMRGQGVADANQITQDGSVGLYEDGFYIARPQAETFDLADVDRVEVLRGPQGTLYGRNTTGGAVNIISKKPTGDFDVKFSIDGGQRNYVRALGTLNLPGVAGIDTKFTLLYSNLAGNVKNMEGESQPCLMSSGVCGAREDYNRENQRGGRFSLRYDQGGPFTVDYFFEIGRIDSTPIYYQDPQLAGAVFGPSGQPYPPTVGLAGSTWQPIDLPISTAKFNADGLTLSLKLNDSMTLRSLTGYRGLDSRFYQDYAGAFTNPGPPASLTNFTSQDVVLSNQFTQEIQLIGNVGKLFDYVAGFYYFKEHASHGENGTINIPSFIPGEPFYNELSYRYVTANAQSRAGYGQITWHITDPLSFTAGARYTVDGRSATRDYTVLQNGNVFIPPATLFPYVLPTEQELGASNSLRFVKFNPAGTLNMAWTPDINTYFRVATGYKAGGSSEAGPIGAFGLTFAPENVTTYELGLKSYWADHTVRANIAVFHSQFRDMQLQFDTDPTNLAIVESYNAGSAHVNGAEFEVLLAPTPDFSLGINDTVLSTDLVSVTAVAGTVFDPAVNPASPYKVGQNVAPLFRLPYAPNNILQMNLDWTLFHTSGGSLELFADWRLQGRQYDTATTGVLVPNSATYYSIPSYGIVNGKLSWNFDTHSKKTMRLSVWAKNLLDKQYQEHVIGQGAAPFIAVPSGAAPPAPPIIPQTGYTYQAVAWAPRAMFGAQFEYGF